jgi:hypothetical protein
MFEPDQERIKQNQLALDQPQPGDYWHERFCPYFVVVAVKGTEFTVLSCLGGEQSYNRKSEPNARIQNSNSTWHFDYSKSMLVDRAWIESAVKYGSIDGFVADVVNGEKTRRIVTEWRVWMEKNLRERIQNLEAEWAEFTGWQALKENHDQHQTS